MYRLIVALVGVLPVAGICQHSRPVDWDSIETESLAHFSELLRIDTTNPPGNETAVAVYLRDALAAEGIESRLYAMAPGRDNLVARIEGNGSKAPVLVMGHTDVVGVQRENWTVEPFDAVRRDGYIYGRGTLDDKDNVTAGMMLLLMLKRAGVELDRDVIFLAEAGEEGTPEVGVDFMVNEHWDEVAAEYCLAEGGGAVARDGVVRYVSIATTEKYPMRVRLIARGTSGHGSVPRPDNALAALAEAVARLSQWQPPMRLNQTTRAYFQKLADIGDNASARYYRGLFDPAEQARSQHYLAMNEPQHNALLRTGVAPTIISGGFRRNVIPAEAEAMLDVRALPDENPEAVLRPHGRRDRQPERGNRPAAHLPAGESALTDRQRNVPGHRGGQREIVPRGGNAAHHAHRSHGHGAGQGQGRRLLRFRPGPPRRGPERRRRRPRRRRAHSRRLAAQAGAISLVRGAGHRRVTLNGPAEQAIIAVDRFRSEVCFPAKDSGATSVTRLERIRRALDTGGILAPVSGDRTDKSPGSCHEAFELGPILGSHVAGPDRRQRQSRANS